MALPNNVPPPSDDPIARPKRHDKYGPKDRDPQEGLVTRAWSDYFNGQQSVIEKAPARAAVKALTNQDATIGATDMTDGTLSAGLYRLSYNLRISVVEAFSTVQVTVDWQDSLATYSFTGAAVSGAALGTYEVGTFLIRIASLSPVRYATTVASLGTLRYELDLVLEEVLA